MPWTSSWGCPHPAITRELLSWTQTFPAGLPGIIPSLHTPAPCSCSPSTPPSLGQAPPCPSPWLQASPFSRDTQRSGYTTFRRKFKSFQPGMLWEEEVLPMQSSPGQLSGKQHGALLGLSHLFPWKPLSLTSPPQCPMVTASGDSSSPSATLAGGQDPAPLLCKRAAASPELAGHKHQHRWQPRRCSVAPGCTAPNFTNSPECLQKHLK